VADALAAEGGPHAGAETEAREAAARKV